MNMGRKLGAALVLLGILLPASQATAEVRMQTLLNEDGTGRLFVNDSGEPPWSWEACYPDPIQCRAAGTGREIATGNAPAGTVFRVTGGGVSGLSPVWHGNVTAVAPPSVTGEIRANELVTPQLATWSGGWDGDFDQTQLAACILPTGSGCQPFTHPKSPSDCENGGAVLDPVFTGKYLRIADKRWGRGTIFTMEAVNPFTQEIWEASPTTAVSVVGQIKPARGPREDNCGSPPLVEASISRNGVARVLCRIGCRVTLVARQGKRKAQASRKLEGLFGLRPKGGSQSTLQLRTGQLKRFRPGRLRMFVMVSGSRIAGRAIAIGRDQAGD